jgi:hypothetical protein
LINPEKFQNGAFETAPGGPLESAVANTYATMKMVIGTRVAVVEDILESKVKNVQIAGVKWATITQIIALIYMVLATLTAFAREDFVNVLIAQYKHSFAFLLCFVILFQFQQATQRKK